MSVFTSQAAVLVLAPILVKVAEGLDVSTAAAGQLRIIAAPVAALVAVGLASFGGAIPLRSILLGSSGLVAVGSLASAASHSFLALALGQLPLWIGVAGLVAGGIGAAGAWASSEDRGLVAARALARAPAAWIVGMRPVEQGRRSASLPALLRKHGASAWVFGEFLVMSAWAGTLVFSGALFIERYGTSARVTGLLLAAVAAAYLWGNTLGSRIRGDCRLRRGLPRANVAAAAGIAATWLVTPDLLVTLTLFAFASMVVGARTVIGTTCGFSLAGKRNIEVGSARAHSRTSATSSARCSAAERLRPEVGRQSGSSSDCSSWRQPFRTARPGRQSALQERNPRRWPLPSSGCESWP
jgi:predicted MFS family arabinose efflux permease